jgi:hypothetical protein
MAHGAALGSLIDIKRSGIIACYQKSQITNSRSISIELSGLEGWCRHRRFSGDTEEHEEEEHVMTKQNILMVAVAALIVGLFGSLSVNAHGGGHGGGGHGGGHGGNGHHYSHHSDGNGGTWQMRDDQTRHCRHDVGEESLACSEWN